MTPFSQFPAKPELRNWLYDERVHLPVALPTIRIVDDSSAAPRGAGSSIVHRNRGSFPEDPQRCGTAESRIFSCAVRPWRSGRHAVRERVMRRRRVPIRWRSRRERTAATTCRAGKFRPRTRSANSRAFPECGQASWGLQFNNGWDNAVNTAQEFLVRSVLCRRRSDPSPR